MKVHKQPITSSKTTDASTPGRSSAVTVDRAEEVSVDDGHGLVASTSDGGESRAERNRRLAMERLAARRSSSQLSTSQFSGEFCSCYWFSVFRLIHGRHHWCGV